jgi:hypothetical protein
VYYLEIFARAPLKKIAYLGTASFGVFFVHGYFLAGIKIVNSYTWGGTVFPANSLTYLLFMAAIVFISCVTLLVAQKILGSKSRLFVGA